MPNGKKRRATRWQLTNVKRDYARTDIRASNNLTVVYSTTAGCVNKLYDLQAYPLILNDSQNKQKK